MLQQWGCLHPENTSPGLSFCMQVVDLQAQLLQAQRECAITATRALALEEDAAQAAAAHKEELELLARQASRCDLCYIMKYKISCALQQEPVDVLVQS